MEKADVIPSIVLSAHVLARFAAADSGNDAPSAQWRALGLLERQGGMRVGELAAAARTTQPGMTRLIGVLEREGLVTRSTDPADTRATRVSATPQGLTHLAEWRSQLRDSLAPRFADLGDQEWTVLSQAARILADHAQESTTTGEPL
ncbi:MarR family winged helix-turn-helix transcriptional regulator [Microbacterium suwonense]|nr:MarR family winged helix-turn-helix transcriptional regulator [Microbacterium suwonense]